MFLGIRILEDCPKGLNFLIGIQDMAVTGEEDFAAFPGSFCDHHGVPYFLMRNEFLHADLEADLGQNTPFQRRKVHGRIASCKKLGESSLGEFALQGGISLFIDPSEFLKDRLSNHELSMRETLTKRLQSINDIRIPILLIKEDIGVNGNEQQLFSHQRDCGRSGAWPWP